MKIVGCDLHARQQTIAMVDTESGEFTEKTLHHEGNAVQEFYASLNGPQECRGCEDNNLRGAPSHSTLLMAQVVPRVTDAGLSHEQTWRQQRMKYGARVRFAPRRCV
jgi:cytochrome c-type biogenesis protein CcmH/NrfF